MTNYLTSYNFDPLFSRVYLKESLADRDQITSEIQRLLRHIVAVNFALANPKVTIDKTDSQKALDAAIALVHELEEEREIVLQRINLLWQQRNS